LSYERLCRDRSVVLGSNCGTGSSCDEQLVDP